MIICQPNVRPHRPLRSPESDPSSPFLTLWSRYLVGTNFYVLTIDDLDDDHFMTDYYNPR